MKSILVVEDDEGICEVLSLILKNEGFDVQLNHSGHLHEENWAILPDLIPLDIWLPEINGGDVCTRLKRQTGFRDIPIIMMSANTDLETISDTCHANDFLPKPFDINLLILKVNNLL